MSALKDRFLSLESNVDDDPRSIEDIEFALESIDNGLNKLYSEMYAMENIEDHVSQFGIESIEEIINDFNNFGLEQTLMKKHLYMIWDEWFTIRHRFFQGIVDLLRSKEKNIEAYKKKLASKGESIAKKDLKNIDGMHIATYIAIEKFWKFNNGKYPTNIAGALSTDFSEMKDVLDVLPKNVATTIDTLFDIIKSSKDDVEKVLDDKFKKLLSIPDLFPKKVINVDNRYLLRTIIFIKNDSKPIDFKTLTNKIDVKIKYGGVVDDLINAYVPDAEVEEFTITSKDIVKIHEFGLSYLDLASDSIKSLIKYISDIENNTRQIGELMKDKELTREDASDISKYISNITSVLGKPYDQLINRQIKMAKGINYLLIRSINRNL